MELRECREKIDAIDVRILDLLNERAIMAKKIGLLKQRAGLPVVDDLREEAVLRRVMAMGKDNMSRDCVLGIFRQILAESRRIQSQARSGEAAI